MPDPLAFAEDWCAAWNAHDLDRLLGHFHEDVVFTSPVAARVVPGSGGRILGKAALRAYWAEGLRLIPDLKFSVEQVFSGIDAITIQYRNQNGALVNEVLVFEGEKVRAGYGTYLVEAKG
jgi:ketosteroid isomerase-like protein